MHLVVIYLEKILTCDLRATCCGQGAGLVRVYTTQALGLGAEIGTQLRVTVSVCRVLD